jgi:hypothetical protein
LAAMLCSRGYSTVHVCSDAVASGFSISGNSKLMTYTEIEQRVAVLED